MFNRCDACGAESRFVKNCPDIEAPLCSACCCVKVLCDESINCERKGPKVEFKDGEWTWEHVQYRLRFKEDKQLRGRLVVHYGEMVKFHGNVNLSTVSGKETVLKNLDEEERENVLSLLNSFACKLERAIGERNERRKKNQDSDEREYPLGDNLAVRHSDDGLSLIRHTSNGGETERIAVDGHIEILERLDVDGESYFRVNFDEEKLLNFKGLVQELRKSGRVVDRRNVEDVLSATIRACPNLREVHSTFGVYENDGNLEICTDPVPVRESQAKAWDKVASIVDQAPNSDQIEAYIEMMQFWHPYEILPALGIGIASPFALLLRTRGILYPYVFHYALESDLGKSLTAMMATDKLYGLEHTSGPGINSEYRLVSEVDAICLAKAVEEAEKIKDKLWPIFKESAERRLADKRGTPDLGMIDYLSRSPLICTGNSLPISTEAVLKRFLVIRFDSAARLLRRADSRDVSIKYNELAPIGFQLLRWAVELWPTFDDLLVVIQEWEDSIQDKSEGWVSPKRPQAWACVYMGLKILENGCKRTGVQWKAPSIEEFVEAVVKPVEASTWGFKRVQAETFASWFAMWRSRNEVRIRDFDESRTVVKGEGEIFREDSIKVGRKDVEGYWITASLLDEFNKVRDGEERIPSLTELAKQSADLACMPYSEVLDSNGNAKVIKLGKKPVRAAFLPDSIRGYTQFQCNFVTFEKPDSVTKDGSEKRLLVSDEPDSPKIGQSYKVTSKSPTPYTTKDVFLPSEIESLEDDQDDPEELERLARALADFILPDSVASLEIIAERFDDSWDPTYLQHLLDAIGQQPNSIICQKGDGYALSPEYLKTLKGGGQNA